MQYGDAPPPGVKATPLQPPARPPRRAGAAATRTRRASALTPAEKDAEFRKRQQDGQKERGKAGAGEQEARQARELRARAGTLRTLESGQRIARTDAKGERYFLDDAQIAQEAARARRRAAVVQLARQRFAAARAAGAPPSGRPQRPVDLDPVAVAKRGSAITTLPKMPILRASDLGVEQPDARSASSAVAPAGRLTASSRAGQRVDHLNAELAIDLGARA